MTPYHSVFRGVMGLCKSIGIGKVTDYVDGDLSRLQDEPLIYLGESSVNEVGKSDLHGRVNHTIHIYGLMKDRKNVDIAYGKIRNGLVIGIEEYGYSLTSPSVSLRVLQDVSTEKRLIHYVVEYGVNYNKK